MLPQWHVKDPGHSAKSAGGRLHVNMHTLLTQLCQNGLTMPSRHSVGTYQENEVTRNSSCNARLQSSQLAEPLWTDPCLKSGIRVRKLIFFKKKKKIKAQKVINASKNLHPKSSDEGKKPPLMQPGIALFKVKSSCIQLYSYFCYSISIRF